MTFTINIPATGQSLGFTRDKIKDNFTNYKNLVSQDHFGPNNANQGKHMFATLVEQAASPGTAANEMKLYTKDVAGVTQLFLQREGLAPAGADIQMTKGIPSSSATKGSSFLPGGFIVNWGNEPPTAIQPIEFNTPFNTPLMLIVTVPDFTYGVTTGGKYSYGSPSQTGFTFTPTGLSSGNRIMYIAIGL